MSHGAIVGKYAGRADYDQELHEDYTNNTLAFPASGRQMIDVPMIVYYTDVTDDLAQPISSPRSTPPPFANWPPFL